MTILDEPIDRRAFLRRGATIAGGSIFAVPALQGLMARADAATGRPHRTAGPGAGGYGPLVRKKPKAVHTVYPGAADIEWLALPEGFEYLVFGVTLDPMTDGNLHSFAHDGGAVFDSPGGRIRYVRNQENRSPGGPTLAGSNAYDPAGGGGCTTIELEIGSDGVPVVVKDFVSLNGTIVNCAGGRTPSGSWVSSEETVETRAGVKHGYNFEVPSGAEGPVEPIPLTAMGRFSHEAICVDPGTGIVYETEDAGESGFFRFLPVDRSNLAAGGKLQMMKLKKVDRATLITGQHVGRALPVEWVTIEDPDPSDGGLKTVFNEGRSKGGAAFSRLEGCWFGNGAVYFNATNGGDAGEGQVWEYKPAGASGGFLRLVYESPGGDILSFPDNLLVTPRGGLLLCEDHGFARSSDPFVPLTYESGSGAQRIQYLKGLTRDGRIFDFAANLVDNREWAGADFTGDGTFMFVNAQGTTSNFNPSRPQDFGRTFAIWGPWERGAL